MFTSSLAFSCILLVDDGALAKDMAANHVLLEKPFAVPLLSQAIQRELNR